MIKQEELAAQSLDSNPSVEYEYLTNKTYEELLASHELAKQFIASLGELKDSPITQSLAAYCREMKVNFRSCQFVVDLMEARLNKMIKNNKIKKNWSEDDLQILVWLMSKYLQTRGIESHEAMTKPDWQTISSMIPGSTSRSCMFKFVSLKKFKLSQHKWQKEEENILFKIINEIGTNSWKIISERLYEENPKKRIFRTAKQCRQHWSCYLNPSIKKGPWDREEDKKLLQIVLDSKCQKKWSLIKQEFEGRTENALKNRYNLLLQKQRKITPLTSEVELILENLKEEKEETNDQQKRASSEKDEIRTNSSHPNPIIPVVPEQRRNLSVPYNPGFILFFNANRLEDSNYQIPVNTWYFPTV